MTAPASLEHIVADDDDGARLDRWIKRHFPQISYLLVAKWARTGQLRVDGKRAEPSDRLATGMSIRLPPIDLQAPRPEIFSAQSPLTDLETEEALAMVMHRDDHCIVLNKPAGLATQGGTGTTLHVDRLLAALCFGRADKPRLVHRLDKDTSGVLLLARTAKAAAYFSEHFRGRTALKYYWALVMGVPAVRDGQIVAPLAKQAGTGGEKMAVDEKKGLNARTDYHVVDVAGNRAAWLEMQPLTGRTHQLRVHCATISHPIVGDTKYGGKEAFLTGGISRKMHLHARQLLMPMPGGGFLDIVAPLPSHMQASWDLLGFDSTTAPEHDPEIIAATRTADAPKRATPRERRERDKPIGRPQTRRGRKRSR